MGRQPEKPKKYEERLMDIFAFDEDDLDANEAGQLSPAQGAQLQRARNTALSTFALMWLLCGVLAAIVVVLGLRAPGLLPAVMAALLLTAGVSFAFSISRKLSADLRDRRVLAAEGRITLSMLGASDYFLGVEQMKFRLNKQETFLAFKNGDPYRIYYAPRSQRILAVKWLRENDDNLLADDEIDAAGAAEPEQPARRLHH